MNKKVFFCFICTYLFLYLLNYLTPMSFGDDYVYAFVWPGQPMYVPLPETVERISSFGDVLKSQWLHYFTGNGRAPAHLLVQFFVWQGKWLFNIFNSLVFVLLVLEIYWFSHKGKVALHDLRAGTVCGIVFSLWAFTPGFNPVFLWLSGACNYPWMAVVLLAFLLPYVRKFYDFNKKFGGGLVYDLLFFVFGVLAGWGNENSVCWVALVLFLFLFLYRNNSGQEPWMYSGFAGLILGYVLLIFAPGNMARLYAKHGSNWFNMQILKDNLYIFAIVLMFQLILWYFCLKSIRILHLQKIKDQVLQKDSLLVKILCIIAFGMTAIMLLTPSFSLRNGFPGTVQLIISAVILLRMQKENEIKLISSQASKFLLGIGTVYFLLTVVITVPHSYKMHMQMDDLIEKTIMTRKNSVNTLLTVHPFKDSGELQNYLSGFHLSYYDLSEDVHDWGNVAFARYYGIKGIRMMRGKTNSDSGMN